MNLKLEEILIATGGKLIKGEPEEKISGISTDTRTISKENLFIALKGKNFDGSMFLEEAIKKNVEGVIVENGKIKNETLEKLKFCIIVDDTLKALQDIAKYYRNKFKIKLVGITGSNGKTTTKEITAGILKSKFKVLKSKENYNNEIGVPLTLLNLNSYFDVVVLEMAMRNFGEISQLCEISSPDIGIITNIKESHLEILKSKKNIAKAKWELVEFLEKRKGIAVLNKDDFYLKKFAEKSKIEKIFYSIKEKAEVSAKNIRFLGENGFKFDLKIKKSIYKDFILPLLGEHNIYNALSSIAVGVLIFKIEIDLVKESLKEIKPPKARLQLLNGINNSRIINDTYNASPNSMNSALEVLKKLKGKRKILVLGDMKELGKEEAKFHKIIGNKIKSKYFDLLLVIGELGKIIGENAKLPKENIYFLKKHQEAVEILRKNLKEGDLVLVKGSHIMQMEKIVEEVIV
jgi:UDP-N-acetylmuramoyl-tripeptide--D-alanyl-D-alanine ligase